MIRYWIICALILSTLRLHGTGVPVPDALTLWYQHPALKAQEALPVGNGSLGALCYSDPNSDQILLSIDKLWLTPAITEEVKAPDPNAILDLRQQLFRSGPSPELSEAYQTAFGEPTPYAIPAALGELHIEFHGEPQPLSNYQRQLRLREGRVIASWNRGNSVITQEVFSSLPDQVVIVHYTISRDQDQAHTPNSTEQGTLQPVVAAPPTLDISLALTDAVPTNTNQNSSTNSDSRRQSSVTATPDGNIILNGYLGTSSNNNFDPATLAQHPEILHYVAQAQVITNGGHTEVDGDHLHIVGARTITILLAAESNFENQAPTTLVSERISNANDRAINILRSRHLEDFTSKMDLVSLEINGSAPTEELNTRQRIQRIKDGKTDPTLFAQLFHYGRYLMLSSSRPGSLPSSTHGLWLDSNSSAPEHPLELTGSLPLSLAFTEVVGLSDCSQALLELTEKIANDSGAKQANQLLSSGWCAGSHTDIWGRTCLSAETLHGGAWALLPLWERWAFTPDDDEYLRNRLYPLLKGQSSFYLDWLSTSPGSSLLVSSPHYAQSTPGEHSHAIGPAISQQLVIEVFDHTLEAAALLKETDKKFLERLQSSRARLSAGLIVNAEGHLSQQNTNKPTTKNLGLAPLYAAYPSNILACSGHPEFFAGALQSLRTRVQVDTIKEQPWQRAWAMALFARLGQAEELGAQAHAIATEYLHPNLTIGPKDDFDINANFGLCNGIVESLLQSHDGSLHLLPTLPPEWGKSGLVRGLRARGSLLIDFSWEDGKVTNYDIWSLTGKRRAATLHVNGQRVEVNARPVRHRQP